MAVWPTSLQEFVNAGGFSYEIGDTLIRTQMEIGPDKIRRRMTKSVDKITSTIWVNPAQYTILYDFYDLTVNGGTEAFDFTHPITGDTLSVRFLGPPVFSPVGFETYEATINLEVLP